MFFASKSALKNLNSSGFIYFYKFFISSFSLYKMAIIWFWWFLLRFFSRFKKNFDNFFPNSYQSHLLLIIALLIFSWYNLSSFSLHWKYSRSSLKQILDSSIFNFVSKAEDSILLEQTASLEKNLDSLLIRSLNIQTHTLCSSVIFSLSSFLR